MDKLNEESRQQFEEWFKNKIIETPNFIFNEFNETEGEYKVTEEDNIDLYLHIQEMYMAWNAAWQASRASIVVDIDWPEANDDYWKDGEEGAYAQGYEVGKDLTAIKVRLALSSIGLSIKGE